MIKKMRHINVKTSFNLFRSTARPLRRKIPRPGRIFLALHRWPSLTSEVRMVWMVWMGMFKRKPGRFDKKHPSLWSSQG